MCYNQPFKKGRIVFEIDENDPLLGSPRHKFFELLRHANQNLVEDELERWIERMAVMQRLLERHYDEPELAIREALYEDADALDAAKTDFYIGFVSDLLSQHE
jgi:hypothetical protein